MAAPLAELKGVFAGYGTSDVLKDVGLTVNAGEAWAVLGPNGAGKSTLARVLLGLLPTRTGTVQVCGRWVAGTSAAELARHVAWVPQRVPEDTGFTALELTLLGRAPHLGPWGLAGTHDVQLAKDALAALGVAHLEQRPLAEVSGGEARRVWLARALVQAPKLLVLDEPTAFLDVRHQVETLAAVRARVDAGLGAVAVLHDVNQAAHFATHALLLKDGAALAAGPVAEVLTPASLEALFGIPLHVATEAERIFVPAWRTP